MSGQGPEALTTPELPAEKPSDLVILWWLTDAYYAGEELAPEELARAERIVKILEAIESTPQAPKYPTDKQLAEIAKKVGEDIDKIIDRSVVYGPRGVILEKKDHETAA